MSEHETANKPLEAAGVLGLSVVVAAIGFAAWWILPYLAELYLAHFGDWLWR